VHHCYRFFFVRAIRQWVEESFVDGQIFGKCTLASVVALVVAPDVITRRKSLHVTTDHLDNAYHIASDDERETEIHGKSASANMRVDWIDCDCNHLYQGT